VLFYEVAGSGPTLLLLHSGVGDRRQWDPQWAALTRRFAVARGDLRGFGETPLDPVEFSNADDVAELVDRLGWADVALVGSSYGGRVAMETAVTHPHLVRRLVLLCPAFEGLAPTPDVDAFGTEEERLLEDGDVEGAVELNVRTWLGPLATDREREHVRMMQRRAFEVQDAAERLEHPPRLLPVPVDPERIRCRTVVVSGGRDLVHFRSIAAHLARTVADAEHVEWLDVAHLPNLEAPDRTTELLLDRLG
jgi:pimeloyl-ACP methyl ester carboxylesterase